MADSKGDNIIALEALKLADTGTHPEASGDNEHESDRETDDGEKIDPESAFSDGSDDTDDSDSGSHEYTCEHCRAEQADRYSHAKVLVAPLDMQNLDWETGEERITTEARSHKKFSTAAHPVSAKFIAKLNKCKDEILGDDKWKAHRELWMKPIVEDKVEIDKIVVLALSGFYDVALSGAGPFEKWFYELACVLVIEELIRAEKGQKNALPIFYQDPTYLAQDVDILNAIGGGGEVIWHPNANRIIDQRTFLFAQSMPWTKSFEVIYRSDPAVFYGTAAEHMFFPQYAYDARQHIRHISKGKDPGDVKDTMLDWLRPRKVKVGVEVPMPDLPPLPQSWTATYTSDIFFGPETAIYWGISGGNEVRDGDEILAKAEKLRQAVMDKEIAGKNQVRARNGLKPLSEAGTKRFRLKRQGFNAVWDLNVWYESLEPISAEFREKFNATKKEILTNENWAPYRDLVRRALEQGGTKIDKVVTLGVYSFYDAASLGKHSMEIWFYEVAQSFALAQIVAEKQGDNGKVEVVFEYTDDDDLYVDSVAIHNPLGTNLVLPHEIKDFVDSTALVVSSRYGRLLAEVAESLLSSPPAIYIGQRIEWLVDGALESDSTDFDAKRAAVGFLQTHQSELAPSFSREYLEQTGMAIDDEPDFKFFGDGEAIYWPNHNGEQIELDVDTIIKEYPQAKFIEGDSDDSHDSEEEEEEEDEADW